MDKRLEFLWILLLFTVLTRAQSDLTCPVFGNDQSSNFEPSDEGNVFLNFESPSQCRGNVTSYRYCHYSSATEIDQFLTGARLMVYRRSSPTSNLYTLVPGSLINLTLQASQVNSFQCRTASVSETFKIQENDVVGACVMTPQGQGSIRPLYIIGETEDELNKLYQLGSADSCTINQIASVDTGDGNFRELSTFILHLYANIVVSASCQAGSNPPATAPRTSNVEGTYLNTDNPVACATENTITSWHYCYYTSPLTAGQTYTITVAVWRLDTPSNTYTLTAGSARTITLVHVATLAKIFCLEETLGSAESVFVSGGDVIGVVLPSSNPIPVVSSDSSSSSSLMRHPQTDSATDLPSSDLITISLAGLHLYCTLASPPESPATDPFLTTQPLATASTPPSTASTSSSTLITINASTTPDSSEVGVGVTSKDIAAMIVPIVVMGFIVLGMALSTIVYKRRRKKSASLQQTGGGEMTRNQVYEVEIEGNMEVTQNKAYGQLFGENIEMTSNQVYGLRTENRNPDFEQDMYEYIIHHQEL